MNANGVNGEATETSVEAPSGDDTLELSKKQSYMSEARFNGEIATPSKIEESEQIFKEEL